MNKSVARHRAHSAGRALRCRIAPTPLAPNRQAGQVLAEYIVVLGALAALFTVVFLTDADVLQQMLAAVTSLFRRFSFALSLPT